VLAHSSVGRSKCVQLPLHIILTAADIIVHKDEQHRDWGYLMEVTEDGKYLILYTWNETEVGSAF
jgi:hypothetical protein